MEKLLPEQLKESWRRVEREEITADDYKAEYLRLFGEYRNVWEQGLILNGKRDLQESILYELGTYFDCNDPEEVRRRCTSALSDLKDEWFGAGTQGRGDRGSVEQFYDRSQAMAFELMWWHTLQDDNSPLAYVAALHFARQNGCSRCLDFGAGVGSGAILFGQNGLEITLADISSSMLAFCRWRMELRKMSAQFVDLKTSSLPANAFDMVTAMDVFEHLVDPVGVVEDLARAMRPGGYLFGRLHAEVDEERPHHIVRDFAPTLERMHTLGFVEVWRDDWVWGHQVFQKR